MLKGLGVESWGLAWDVFHSFELNPADEDAYCRELAPLAKIIHVKARRSVCECGETLLPYDKILGIARESGYEGAVAVETHNPEKDVSAVEMSKRIVDRINAALTVGTA